MIARRPVGKPFAGLWELPGGKLEVGEDARAALDRELAEEVGIEALEAHAWMHLSHDYGDRVIDLSCWQVTHFAGEARPLEGQSLRWISPDQVRQYRFPPANAALIEAIERL